MIPQPFLDEVLSRIDILDIIEPRVNLKKTASTNYLGLCPFHQEKSPSFTVSQAKQFYYCFGCKAHGNAIGFLMNYENLTFREAVDELASKAGLQLPQENEIKPELSMNFMLLEKSATYYQSQLTHCQSAKQYLQSRELSTEVISLFRIGYAPSGWTNLQKAFGNEPNANKILLESGMLVKKENGDAYDRFRERIMFPIRNQKGQIIAFGGRSLGQQMPKYLNSPETLTFQKSKELYGLYESLQVNQKFDMVIVVEGYLDVIALHQFGFTQTVATLGTAISLAHIQKLLRYTNSLVFCFDGDLAGKTAAWRALEIAMPLMHTGIEIKFLFLPNGEDPDSYVRKLGKENFEQQLQIASSIIDYFFQKLSSETDVFTLTGKIQLANKIEKYLEKQPNGIFQDLMYDRLSTFIGLSKERLHEVLMKSDKPQIHAPSLPLSEKKLPHPIRLAICLLLQYPALYDQVTIPPTLYNTNIAGINILKRIIGYIEQNTKQTTGSLLEYFSKDEEKTYLIELATQDLLLPEQTWQKELDGAFNLIMQMDQEMQIQSLLSKGKKEGLTEDEKKLLQNLLISQKQL